MKYSVSFGRYLLPLLLGLRLAASGPSLIWTDEFSQTVGTQPDPTKWSYDIGVGSPAGWGNNELETYTSSTNNIQVISDADATDGKVLVIRAQKDASGNYTSARIKTQSLFSSKYSRMEMRAKLPSGTGLWPAFWALGDNLGTAGWPACGEIDIMENLGQAPGKIYGTLHASGDTGSGLQGTYTLPSAGSFGDGYHVFALDWYPDRIVMSVDGTVYFVQLQSAIPANWSWPFNQNFFMILNLAVGGNWPGNPNSQTSFPADYRIDYVRVYSLPGTAPAHYVWAPQAPSSLQATSPAAGQVSLVWQAGSTFGAPLKGYTVTRATDSAFTQNVTTFNAGTTASYLDASAQSGTTYYYEVTATSTGYDSTSATTVTPTSDPSSSAQVTVPAAAPAAPTLTTQPASQIVAAGSAASFSVSATGTPAPTYQWYHNTVALSGATTATCTVAAAAASDAGSYSVIVSNSSGSVSSAGATLTVLNGLPGTQPVVAGKSVAFTIGTTGVDSVQWQVSTDGGTTWSNVTNGTNTTGATSAVLEISQVSAGMNNYQYRYVASVGGISYTSPATKLAALTSVLNLPDGIQSAGSGNFVVADAANQVIRQFGSALKVTTLAGSLTTLGSADGTGTASFNEPTGIAISSDGSLIVTDTGNHTLRKVTAAGAVSTFAGIAGSSGSADGSGSAARLGAPVGVAEDSAGNYYVADQTNQVIRKVTAAGAVSTLAGAPGLSGSVDGSGSAARFNLPTGIAVDASGTVYVSDFGSHVIRKITAAGAVATFAGSAGSAGSANGSGSAARFNQPSGLAVDGSGNVYVADQGNHVIRVISPAGVVTTLAGLATVDGLMDGQGVNALFNQPEFLTLDASGNLYVSDTGNAVIRKVTSAGLVSTLALAGSAPSITSQPGSQTVNSGASASFSVTAAGDGPLSYQWYLGGAALSGATSSSYSISAAASGNAGTYTVGVTNPYGTTTSASATLTVSTPVTPAPSSGGGGGGGGAPSEYLFAALGLLAAGRLLRRSRPRPDAKK